MKSLRILIRRHGGAEVLETIEEEAPEPGRGEVRLRVLVAGVSFADLLMREGLHPERTPLPFTPGWDVVGIVDRIGEGAPSVLLGRTFASLPIHGGYAQFLCLPPEELTPVPDGVDPAEAVSLMLNYITAWQMLRRVARVMPGQTILVHGAAGGVGTALLQLARFLDLSVFGTASTATQQLVAELGATPIDYQTEDFVAEIRHLTGDGVDAVFDGVGEANVWRSFQALKPGGRVVAYGFTAFLKKGALASGLRYRFRGFLRPGWYALRALLAPGRRRILPYSIQFLKRRKPARFREDLAELLGLLRDGKVKPLIAGRLPLREARRAQQLLGEGGVRGKLVLVCNDAPHQ